MTTMGSSKREHRVVEFTKTLMIVSVHLLMMLIEVDSVLNEVRSSPHWSTLCCTREDSSSQSSIVTLFMRRFDSA
jgi:hypothetical protein